jgi:glucosylceramidase
MGKLALILILAAPIQLAAQVRVWHSSESPRGQRAWLEGPQELPNRLTPQPAISLAARGDTAGTVIRVDPTLAYQPIEGIGSSLEESTIFNLMRMSPEGRRGVLRALVDPEEGIGMNLMRICLGTSDFTARQFYTYDDMPPGETDPDLRRFSIQKDIDYHIIAVLREALAINPGLKFVASPWSPPGWMKTSGAIVGGDFLSEYTDVYARYLRMAVEAYAKQGIGIHALTLQNEPLYVPPDYPGCHMTAEQQRDLAPAVRRELDAHGLDTRILVYDHNFDRGVEYAGAIMSDVAARKAVYGTAFHSYGGKPGAMSELHRAHPDKAIWFTERSYWGANGMAEIAELFRNWARTYNGWVTMLDSKLQPEQWSGRPGPTWLIQNADKPDDIWYTADYYLVGQFTRFVKLGAVRIESSSMTETSAIQHIGLLNPGGEVVLVVINKSAGPQEVTVVAGKSQFQNALPPKTVATYVWQAAQD